MNKNENSPFIWEITRFLFLAMILFCINPRSVKAQPIIGAGQYVKIIKLIINDRRDIVSQLALGSKYKITRNIDAYELDNILYKYDILFECTTGQKWGDHDFYPFITIGCREFANYYEEISIGFTTVSSCEILHFQYVELMNFINDYFGITLADSFGKIQCNALASMDEISFPKFKNSNVEIGSCSIYLSKPVLETFSVLSFNLKLYKRKQ